MQGNTYLNKAKHSENTDEWYTDYQAIVKEVDHYAEQLRGKTILCNCNDSAQSSFTQYFVRNFNQLELAGLLCVSYADAYVADRKPEDAPPPALLLSLFDLRQLDLALLDEERIMAIFRKYGKVKKLQGNGDFQSEECVKLLAQADIVITNPRFSKFKELFTLLTQHDKQYLLICNHNAITYKEVFPHLKDNRTRVGYNFGEMAFRVPHDTEPRPSRFWIDAFGQKWRSLGNAMWLTNLEVQRAAQALVLEQSYSPELYQEYDNFPALHIPKVTMIPHDYMGIMGVPITYLKYHDEEQFQIIGEANHGSDNEYDLFKPLLNGKETFKRILIQRRPHQKEES